MTSRRDFLKMALGTSATMLVAACSSAPAAAPTSAPAAKQAEPAAKASPAASPAASPGASPAASPAAAAPAAAAAKPTGPLKKVRVGVSVLVTPLAALFVAQRKGYYQEEGLDAELSLVPGQGNQGLLAGNLDFVAGGATDLMIMAERGETMQAIATVEPVILFQLQVRPEVVARTGITPNDPLEKRLSILKGLRMAVVSEGGAGDLVLRTMLKEAKLQPTDIQKIIISSEAAQLAALEQGQIDGIMGGPPRSHWLERDKTATIMVTANEIPAMREAIYEVVFGHKAWLDSHPDEARGMARAMAKANRFLKEDPGAAKLLVETDFKATPEDILQLAIDNMKAYIPADGKMTQRQWDALEVYSKEVGLLTKDIDTTEGTYWTNKYLN